MILRRGRESFRTNRALRHRPPKRLASPVRTNRTAAISFLLKSSRGCLTLEAEATVNDVDLARCVAGFVRGQIDRQRRNFLRTTDAPHRLSRYKFRANFLNVTLSRDPLLQGRGLHSSRADRIATHATADKVSGNCFRQPNHCRLRASVNKAVGRRLDARCSRRHINDASLPRLQHTWKKSTACSIHGLDVEIEGEVPILFRTIENSAVMHIAGTVEQNIKPPNLRREARNSALVQDIQPVGLN